MPGNFHSVPESVIASWPTPNYVDPVRRTWLPALAYALVSVQTVLLAGRFYLRARRMAGEFGYDDLFIFIGYVVSIGFATTAVLGSERFYLDRHTWDVPIESYVGTAKNGWIAQILFIISTCATKASILLFYRRMAKDTYSVLWRYAIWLALAFTFAFFVAVLVAYCFICQPLDAYWLSYDFTYNKSFKCLNGNALSPLVGALSILSDLYATILPWCMLYKYNLDVPRRQKIALNIIFSLSLIVAGCGGSRTYYLWKINNSYDTSWNGFNLFVWALLECHLAIIFACAPSMRAFVRRYLSDPINRTFRSGAHSRNGNLTKDSSVQNSSALRSSLQATTPSTDRPNVVSQQGFVMPDKEAMTVSTQPWSRRSSDTMPIANAEDYESYNLRQLRRYGYSDEKGQSQGNGGQSITRSFSRPSRAPVRSPSPQAQPYSLPHGNQYRGDGSRMDHHARDRSNASDWSQPRREIDVYSAV